MKAKRNVQGRLTAHVSQESKVQKQIRALQKRCRALEYDIIDLRLKMPKPISEPRQIGFIVHNNLKSDNEFDNE